MRFFTIYSLIFLALVALFSISCNSTKKPEEPQPKPTIEEPWYLPEHKDVIRQIESLSSKKESTPQKIVSIAPSTTELLYEYGVGEFIVGATSPHNFPPDAENLPSIGELTLDKERIIALDPDILIGEKNLYAGQTDSIKDLGIPVLLFDTRSVGDLGYDLRVLDEIFKLQKAEILMASTTESLDFLSKIENPPKVAAIISSTPLILAAGDSYFGNLIKTAGGKLITIDTPGDYITLSREDLIRLDPEIILCTFDGIRDDLIADLTLENVSAIRENRIFAMDPDIVLRPTLRSISEGAVKMKLLFLELFSEK
jgi:iron complex transport system substrate-binding protein